LGDFLLWAIFYFGRFFTLGVFLLWAFFTLGVIYTTEVSQFLGHFFHSKSCEFFLTENGFGNILGDLFTTSSGHPVQSRYEMASKEISNFSDIFHIRSRMYIKELF
jgi:hypothetical protein